MTKPADCPVANEPCQCMCMDGCILRKPKEHDGQHPYVRKLIGCGHGVLFKDYCQDCEIVGLQEEYRNAIRTVQRVRDRLRVLGKPMPGQTSIKPSTGAA